jgi:pilus assembly protein Flp/PilA
LLTYFYGASEHPRGVGQELFMRALLARFLSDEGAATAIEYAIVAGGISIVIVAVVKGIGLNLSGRFESYSSALK